MPPYPRYCVQSIDCGRTRLLIASRCPASYPLSSTSLSDFCRLHVQCASCRFDRSLGCPPFAIGMIWSMHGDSGCGYLYEKSTGFPQMPHTFCVARIFFLFFSNAPLWLPSWSSLFILFSPHSKSSRHTVPTASLLHVQRRNLLCLYIDSSLMIAYIERTKRTNFLFF